MEADGDAILGGLGDASLMCGERWAGGRETVGAGRCGLNVLGDGGGLGSMREGDARAVDTGWEGVDAGLGNTNQGIDELKRKLGDNGELGDDRHSSHLIHGRPRWGVIHRPGGDTGGLLFSRHGSADASGFSVRPRDGACPNGGALKDAIRGFPQGKRIAKGDDSK
ncbi:unnamed protein product, partial [Ilex paraguariensis]